MLVFPIKSALCCAVAAPSRVPYSNDQSERLAQLRDLHQPGTRLWLLKLFREWVLDAGEPQLMLVTVDAGVGKSVIAAMLSSEVLKRSRPHLSSLPIPSGFH